VLVDHLSNIRLNDLAAQPLPVGLIEQVKVEKE